MRVYGGGITVASYSPSPTERQPAEEANGYWQGSNFQNHNYYIYCTDCEVRIRKFLNVAVKQGIL